MLKLPPAPRSIQKGVPLTSVLDVEAVSCLASNIAEVYPAFDHQRFVNMALAELAPLGIMDRGRAIAAALRACLPTPYSRAIEILLASLTPPMSRTDELGLAVFFYLPHVFFVAQYGIDPAHNAGEDPFPVSMQAQYELTKRFSAEFSIRHFLLQDTERTLSYLNQWVFDPDPHVRRLCSEGTRPRLPWAMRLPNLIQDPTPVLPILEALKDDPDRYVVRSVANHLGDIAKDHLALVLATGWRWLDEGASNETRWLIRHAVRHPAKKGVPEALQLRAAAKAVKML